MVLGAGLTVLLALLGNAKEPPPASTQGLIAVGAIAVQFGGAWLFSGEGRADPTLATRSVGHLLRLAARASLARNLAEQLNTTSATVPDVRKGIGELSVHLSYLEEGFIESVEDWKMFHANAVEQAEGSLNGGN